jgi:transcription antitermination factor NusG
MNIEDVKIEDAADANYVIRKFFNNQLKNINMSQLEQLVLTVYNMGKNQSSSAGSECPVSDAPPKPANPFKINDKVKAIEDIEIGRSGEFVKADTEGTVNSVNEDKVSFIFESDEDGEMIEVSALFSKFEKID